MSGKSLLIGGSSRIGRMVLGSWRSGQAQWSNDPAQFRRQDSAATELDLIWDVSQGVDPVRQWMDANGPISCLTVLAGVTPATGSNMDDNVIIAAAYLQAAHALGIPRVLLASSSAVYGAGDGSAMSEDSPCQPANDYGLSKQKTELAAARWRDKGVDVCCMRIGNIAGADALLLNGKNASAAQPLRIDCFQNGHGPERSYLGPNSLGYVLGTLAYHVGDLPFVLNVAAPRSVYMDQLADAAGLPWQPCEAAPHMQQSIVLDCARLAQFAPLELYTSTAAQLVAEWKDTVK